MVQMAHDLNLNESGEWLFCEAADVMLYLRADQSDMNSFDDRFVKLELSSK
jgi:transcriptional antiterminator Rof (Rho-off)